MARSSPRLCLGLTPKCPYFLPRPHSPVAVVIDHSQSPLPASSITQIIPHISCYVSAFSLPLSTAILRRCWKASQARQFGAVLGEAQEASKKSQLSKAFAALLQLIQT